MERERYFKNLKKIAILSKNKSNSKNTKLKLGKELIKSIKNLGCDPEKSLYYPKNLANSLFLEGSLSKKGTIKIGEGEWGKVYVGCIDEQCNTKIAIKIQKKDPILHEYKMGRRLTPLGGVVKPFYYKKCDDTEVMYTEYANNGNLYDYLKNNKSKLLSIHYRTIVTQVIYTLYKIYNKYPTFRHNDLHLKNILINTNLKPSRLKTYKVGNTTLKVHDIGLDTLITDFGYSTLKSFKCPPIDEDPVFYKSDVGIFRGSHYMYDLHLFLNFMHSETKDTKNAIEIRQFIERVLPPEYIGEESQKIRKGRLRASPLGHPKLPTYKKIFSDRFFLPYKKVSVPLDINTSIKRRTAIKPKNILVKHGGKIFKNTKKIVTVAKKGYIRLGTRKCESYTKSELVKIAQSLNINTKGKTIKKICEDIKIKYT